MTRGWMHGLNAKKIKNTESHTKASVKSGKKEIYIVYKGHLRKAEGNFY